jgi:hypothetical protein
MEVLPNAFSGKAQTAGTVQFAAQVKLLNLLRNFLKYSTSYTNFNATVHTHTNQNHQSEAFR